MIAHLGYPIPSPAIMDKIATAFRKAVDRFAADSYIPVVRFGKHDRKVDVMRPYLAAQARTGRSGVAAIGTAQEFRNVFACARHTGDNGVPWFSFSQADRRVTCFYFYLWDNDFGSGFIKVCAYFPYPIKVWLNDTSGANDRPSLRGWGLANCPTASPTPAIPRRCKPSVTGSVPVPSRCFSSGG